MKKIIIILILISANYLYGKNIQIKIDSDENSYSLNDTVNVTVKITSNDAIQLNRMPKIKNLKLTGTPSTSTMQSYKYINGVSASNTSVTYTLSYIPLKEGDATIGPIKMKINGKLYISNKLKLKITKSTDDLSNITENDYKYKFDPELFIVAKVDKPEVYIGEQVIVTYELYHRVDVDFAEQPVIPSYKNFWLEELDANNFQRSKRKIYKGYYFKVTPLARMALFPIKAGEITLPPFRAKFKADIFSFGISPNKVYNRVSNLVKLKVKPLPENGKPNNFPDGNVGNYTFSVSVSKSTVKVNEPFTINMSVKGIGNVKNLSLPKLTNIKNFKIYDPTESVKISNKGIIRGSKSISIALKAEKPGKYKSFDLKFKYFNPKTKKYRVIDYGDLELTVTGKALAKTNNKNLKDITNNSSNNHKILVSLKPIMNQSNELIKEKNNNYQYILLIFFLITLPFIYLIIYIYIKRKYKHISNKDIILMKNSYKKVMNLLKKLEKNNPDARSFYGELHSIIISYIEDKFSIVAKGLTIEQIAIFLEEKKLDEKHIKIITDTLENSQYIKYSNIKINDDDKIKSLTLIRTVLGAINRGE